MMVPFGCLSNAISHVAPAAGGRNRQLAVLKHRKALLWLHQAATITAYLEAGWTLENAQAMAAHESPRTTKLYDRTADVITLDEVEPIMI
jgi:hypothetical protein